MTCEDCKCYMKVIRTTVSHMGADVLYDCRLCNASKRTNLPWVEIPKFGRDREKAVATP